MAVTDGRGETEAGNLGVGCPLAVECCLGYFAKVRRPTFAAAKLPFFQKGGSALVARSWRGKSSSLAKVSCQSWLRRGATGEESGLQSQVPWRVGAGQEAGAQEAAHPAFWLGEALQASADLMVFAHHLGGGQGVGEKIGLQVQTEFQFTGFEEALDEFPIGQSEVEHGGRVKMEWWSGGVVE